MSGKRRRSHRNDRGQALAEQGIILAVLSGLDWLTHLSDVVMQQPPAVLFLGGVIAVAIVYVWMSGRT